MWYRAVRAFVITSMVLNAALAIALVTAMASGLRPPSILDFAACGALLFGFLNAVGDLIESERPVITGTMPRVPLGTLIVDSRQQQSSVDSRQSTVDSRQCQSRVVSRQSLSL